MTVLRATRRGFLRGALGAGVAGGIATGRLPLAAAHHRGRTHEGVVVVVSLVGGVDGLSVLVPYGDPALYRRRPTIAIGPPGERHGAIDLGRGLGLHPALAPLYNTVGRAERLAIIGGVGVPDGEPGVASHVASREFLHHGGRGQAEGWAARMLRFDGLGAAAAWAFGPGPHPMFAGLAGVVSAPAPAVSVGAHHDRSGAGTAIATAYGGTTVLERAGTAALAASGRWSGVDWAGAQERAELGYPDGSLARSLARTAEMIKADRGLRVVAIDHDGFDTHVDQGDGRGGQLAHRLDRLARSLAAFWHHLDDDRDGVVVVVVSEFGRAIDENGAGGTEHGRGGVAMIIGDDVVGGFHGDRPDLAAEAESWSVTIDVRRVLADAAWSAGFEPWRGGLFPGLPLPNRSLGLLLSP